MRAGILVPVDREFLEDVIASKPQFQRKSCQQLMDDRLFAEAVYRSALASALMEHVAYQDTVARV